MILADQFDFIIEKMSCGIFFVINCIKQLNLIKKIIMKFISTYTKVLFMCLIFFKLSSGYAASTDVPLKDFTKYSRDTLYKFTKKYGKDSLINILNTRILNAVKYININYDKIYLSEDINKIVAVSKKFNLGFDTLIFPKYSQEENIYQLYEFKEGCVKQINSLIDSLSKTNPDWDKLMFENIENEMSRNVSVVLGGSIKTVNPAYFDSIFSKFTNVSSKDFIFPYWWFTQFAYNYPAQAKVPLIYKDKIFKAYYNEYNFNKCIVKYNQTYKNSIKLGDVNINNEIMLLAYGLYGKNITLKNNGAELFYILTLQDKNEFGWQNTFATNYTNSPITSFYALWSLCEYRKLLLEEPALQTSPIKSTTKPTTKSTKK